MFWSEKESSAKIPFTFFGLSIVKSNFEFADCSVWMDLVILNHFPFVMTEWKLLFGYLIIIPICGRGFRAHKEIFNFINPILLLIINTWESSYASGYKSFIKKITLKNINVRKETSAITIKSSQTSVTALGLNIPLQHATGLQASDSF
jgi:hypothetical protein